MLIDVDANATAGGVSIAIFNPDGTNDRGINAFILSENASTDRTIQLLYPGMTGGLPFAVNESSLTPTELIDTQYPVFRWYSLGWRFKISIFKPLAGQASFGEVIRNRPYYEAIVDGANYFQYPLQARSLESGVRYFWKVTAYFGTVPAEFYSGLNQKGLDDTSFQGEMKESEVWSFVVRANRPEGRDEFRFGTLNAVEEIAIEPSYVEVAPGDRLILELRGYDRNHNLAAFIPGNFLINLGDIERNYPDVKLLPKSFGRAELIVPNVKGNDDFRGRLLRNPAEFGRLPILLYISKNARGVGAVLAVWQNHRYYGFVNVLPPKKTMLENGDIDRFRIGVAERLSETFEVQLDTPTKAGSVISGSGRLFIDAAGFREKGFFPVKIEDVRMDINGRAYTGKVEFTGSNSLFLSGFDIEIHSILIRTDRPASVQGGIFIPGEKDNYKLDFNGKINAIGDFSAMCKLDKTLFLKGTKLPEKSVIEMDFDSSWSPEFKKNDPSFRGLALTVETDDGTSRRTIARNPNDLLSLNIMKSDGLRPKQIDLPLYNTSLINSDPGIFLTARRLEDGKVTIRWTSRDSELRFFNVYRRGASESRYRLIAEKISGDEFTDHFVFQEGGYWYKINGVDAYDVERCSSAAVGIE
jgi:hypothetical protein